MIPRQPRRGRISFPTRDKESAIDYKNLELLSNFVTETGKIMPSHLSSGVSRRQQRRIAQAIKRARFLALLPYCDNHR